MVPNTARLILWFTTLSLIALTTVLTLKCGRYWSVSEVLGRVFEATPILFTLLVVVAFWLFTYLVPVWRTDDLLLALIVFTSLGHIGWPCPPSPKPEIFVEAKGST